MADSDFLHGVRVVELAGGQRPIRTIQTAVIGIVCTAPDADPAVFPLNTPVLITNTYSAMAKSGAAGTLTRTLDAITDQARPVVIAVRVEQAETEAETISNVIGGVAANGRRTGMQSLLDAQALLGVTPRILAVPQLDPLPVATELIALAKKLNAMAYLSCYGCETSQQAVAYRDQLGGREAVLIYPDFVSWDTQANADLAGYATARAAGLRAQIDHDRGWHKTLSNVLVQGATGISQPVFFDLQEPSAESNYLNSHQITTLVRQGGLKFWGGYTLDDSGLYPFENYTRSAQILRDTMAEAHLWAIAQPMHPTLVRDMIEGINQKFRTWTNGPDPYLLGGSAWYDESVNVVNDLKIGKLVVDYDYTPVPPLHTLTLQQRITDTYLMDFAARVAAGA